MGLPLRGWELRIISRGLHRRFENRLAVSLKGEQAAQSCSQGQIHYFTNKVDSPGGKRKRRRGLGSMA